MDNTKDESVEVEEVVGGYVDVEGGAVEHEVVESPDGRICETTMVRYEVLVCVWVVVSVVEEEPSLATPATQIANTVKRENSSMTTNCGGGRKMRV